MKTRNNPLTYFIVWGLVLISTAVEAQNNNDNLQEKAFSDFILQWTQSHQKKFNNLAPVLIKREPVALEIDPSEKLIEKNTQAAEEAFFQPAPIILGLPEYPLKEKVDNKINSPFLHQAMVLKLIVLEADGRTQKIENLSYAIKPNDRFKLRLKSMFDAWVTLHQVLPIPNNSWSFKNNGQVFPQLGSAILLKKETIIDLPMGATDYFQLEDQLNEKIVLHVRHEQSKKNSVNQQPIYRRDYNDLSAYVQLVLPGKFPIFEQVISLHHN